jgi:hypothetical protein
MVAGTGHSMTKTFLFTGTPHPALARCVAAGMGMAWGDAQVGHFADGEIHIQIKSDVRDALVFVLQPTCSSEAIVELALLADALKRDQPRNLTLLVPYFGYSRQERRTERGPVSAEVMARLLNQSGTDAQIDLTGQCAVLILVFSEDNTGPGTRIYRHPLSPAGIHYLTTSRSNRRYHDMQTFTRQRHCVIDRRQTQSEPTYLDRLASSHRAGDGTRTRDYLLGRQALYQLSYSRVSRGGRT